MHARTQNALELALRYIRLVQQENPKLHEQAAGSSPVLNEIQGLLSGEGRK